MASTPIKEDEEENFGSAMRVAAGTILPMVVKASIELNLFEIIARAGPNVFLSPSEIASQLGTQNPEAPVVLDRILRFLTSQSLLKCTLATQHGGDAQRRYGLGPVARFFTPDQDGVSVAPLHLLLQDKVFMDSWYHLKDAVLEGGIAFNRAHGMNAFEYPKIDARFNNVFNKAMSDQSTIIIKKVLRVYKGFEGLKELLDVGGGVGTALQIITAHYPQIKGINFDMPHVLADAPSYPGVEHVAGDMFVTIPKCEAIFMKWILHDWSDDHCLKLLKNCFEALPSSGKLIVVESIVPENPEDYPDNGVFMDDVLMLTQNPGGKERTEEEFKALAKTSGFATCEIVCGANEYWVLEFHK